MFSRRKKFIDNMTSIYIIGLSRYLTDENCFIGILSDIDRECI